MLRAVFLISLLLVSHSVLPQDERVSPGRSAISLHTPWENLLQEYVQDDGRVNYKGLLKDQQRLKSYLEALALKPPQEDWTPGARMAYYVNLYNAGTVALILENYPVKSIRDIDRPWAKKRVQVGTEWLSLGDIEHKILRKMGDARIHFAINCASISCPKLPEYAFTEAEIEAQLERAAREFINDTNRNTIYADRAEVSRIFKWFRSDFKADDTSLIEYLNHYLEKPIPDGTPIGFLPYDWSLNDSDL
ncbi:MAG: DUF547 domain-containing protein [Robiginitalea sp.]|uniref:DUF547 domain-containing protein n=1 Tax=Robiginitalea sp. TaxID=1902411 RepID=UPI003C77197A